MTKTILFCGNGLSGEIIREVKDWGYNVCLITEFPHDTGLEYCNKVTEANSKDSASALAAAKALSREGFVFHGVMSLCWDSAESVAAIAEHFNLSGISPAAARLATDKALRSEAFENHGVMAPRYEICSTLKELENVVKEIHYPLVLKPSGLSSGKGVILIRNEHELADGYDYVKRFESGKSLIVNEYICGSEHSTEGLMVDGKLYLTAISDRIFKYKEFEPHFVEAGDIMPTLLNDDLQENLKLITEKAALSLGIKSGVVKGDIIISDSGKVYVLELAARLGGPRFGTEMVPLSNGTCILKAAIQQSMGEPIDLSLLMPKFNKGMVNRSLFPPPGVIRKISGLDTIKTRAGYYDFKWWGPEIRVGDTIMACENGCGNVAYFIASGETRDKAIFNADQIEAEVVIDTQKE